MSDFEGTLIIESLRTGTDVRDLSLTLRDIRRFRPGATGAGQPEIWTALTFTVVEEQALLVAHALSEVLEERGWYVDLRSSKETLVVFPDKVFRYERGDADGRARAQEHGSSLGIPEDQLDWPV
ncbi:hypothetical protein ACFYZ2_33220 [Streptomyces sviceus]|uniref:hypothetical protein n=1 Tax=Streptomyces sviceus TaxID=285530 RepID=UPI00369748A3